MRRRTLPLVLVGAAVLIGTELKAQQPTPPNLDAIPEKMPFSTPYGAPIGAERAQALILTAVAEATQKGSPMNTSPSLTQVLILSHFSEWTVRCSARLPSPSTRRALR